MNFYKELPLVCYVLMAVAAAPVQAATVQANVFNTVVDLDRAGAGGPSITNTGPLFASQSSSAAVGTSSYSSFASADANTGALRLQSSTVVTEPGNAAASGSARIVETVNLTGSGRFTANMAVDVDWAWPTDAVLNNFFAGIAVSCVSGCGNLTRVSTIDEETLQINDAGLGYMLTSEFGNFSSTEVPVDIFDATGSLNNFALSAVYDYSGDAELAVSWVMVVENQIGEYRSAFVDASKTATLFAGVEGTDAGLSFATDGFLANALYPEDVGLVTPAPIPLPASALLLLTGICALAGRRHTVET